MENTKKKPHNQFLKFSGIAMQMGIIIGAGAYGGVCLDEYLEKDFPLFTLLFSLFAVFSALYYVIKEVIHLSDDS
jgi:predicted MFS family arabinose efflux permease